MKQRVCTERCNKPSISNYSVSILRPVSFQDQKYRQYLQALSTATDGAFHFNEPDDQVIKVISPLRTAEKIFSKNGQVFDLNCLNRVKQEISSLAMDGIYLCPIGDDQEGVIQFKRKNSAYELYMQFEPDPLHHESVLRLARILTDMAGNAGKQIHRDDIEALENFDNPLRMKIGHFAIAGVDDFLLSDIEHARNTTNYTPLGVIREAYSYNIDKEKGTLRALQDFEEGKSLVEFDPLTIDLTQRQTRRSS